MLEALRMRVTCPKCAAPPGQPCRNANGSHRRARLAVSNAVTAALLLPCPQCGAAPGQPCPLHRRHKGPDAVHAARLNAARPPKTPSGTAWPMPELLLVPPLCDECGFSITAGWPGVAAVDRIAAHRRGRQHERWTKAKSRGDAGDEPPLVKWRIRHLTCPEPPDMASDGDFTFDAADLATPRRLLHTALRLMPKQWIPHTDLAHVLASIMAASAQPDPKAVEAATRHARALQRARTSTPDKTT